MVGSGDRERRWMLADRENECIVYSKTSTLRLCHIQVVALSVRCGVSKEEIVWRISTGVDDGKCEC